jgi:glucokinase
MTYILAADVGGTKTNIGIFEIEQGRRKPLAEANIPSQNFASFEELLLDFLAGMNYSIDRACFGVAGPVREGRVQLTNLPWLLDSEKLRKTLNAKKVCLINDVEALAHSVPELNEEDIHIVKKGISVKNGTIGVVAPGTGLGMAFLVWNGSQYISCPSEGGHACFSPNSRLTVELLEYMMEKGLHVSFESICSGKGIPYIYDFLKKRKGFSEPDWLKERLDKALDQAPLIFDAAQDKSSNSPLCRATLELFVEILSDVCRNFALTVMATGGMYLGGGIPPRIIDFLKDKNFISRFECKGNMSYLMENMPLKIILNPKAPLIGAIAYIQGKD